MISQILYNKSKNIVFLEEWQYQLILYGYTLEPNITWHICAESELNDMILHHLEEKDPDYEIIDITSENYVNLLVNGMINASGNKELEKDVPKIHEVIDKSHEPTKSDIVRKSPKGKVRAILMSLFGFVLMIGTVIYNAMTYGKLAFSITVLSNLGTILIFTGLCIFSILLSLEDDV